MSIKKQKRFNKILLVLISLFISILLLEIAMRLIGINLPVAFHLSPPNSELRDVQSHWDITYSTNSKGLRDREYSLDKDDENNIRRIVIIGDSFTFGQGVVREEIFPDVLETLLYSEDTPVEVINISNIGIGPESYYVLLKNLGLKYNPDVVILNVYGNDASRLTRESNPKKLIKKFSKDLHLFTFVRNINRKVKTNNNQKKQSELLSSYFEQQNVKQKSFLDDYKKKYGSKTNNLIAGIISDPQEVARWVNIDSEGSGWAEFVFYIEKMNSLCKNNGCSLILGIIPDGAQVDPGQLEVRKTLGVPIDDEVLIEEGKFQSLVKELAETEKIPYFDSLSIFRDVRDGLYFETDLHWTAKGHKLYAEHLAIYLRENNMITK